jgi:hypothetical protein
MRVPYTSKERSLKDVSFDMVGNDLYVELFCCCKKWVSMFVLFGALYTSVVCCGLVPFRPPLGAAMLRRCALHVQIDIQWPTCVLTLSKPREA